MTLHDLVQNLSLEVKTPEAGLDREVSGGYASDLLSDVIGNASKGHVWITVQIHLNIVAVAALKELSGIILVNNRTPESETIARAAEKNVVIMTSPLSSFELIGRLYALGLRCS